MAVSDWSTTAASNVTIGGINVDEGCLPGNINDAIREMMAQIKTYSLTLAPLASPALTGTATADNLTVSGTLTVSGSGSFVATSPAFTTGLSIDGVSITDADLTYLKALLATGVTSTEFDKLDGLTATTTELNKTNGLTPTTAELNKLDGVGTLYHTGNVPPSLGVGQTPQNMSGSRASGTSYRNTTGDAIFVGIEKRGGGGSFQVSSNNSTWLTIAGFPGASGSFEEYYVGFVIPHNWYYRISSGGYEQWHEVRA